MVAAEHRRNRYASLTDIFLVCYVVVQAFDGKRTQYGGATGTFEEYNKHFDSTKSTVQSTAALNLINWDILSFLRRQEEQEPSPNMPVITPGWYGTVRYI